MKFFEDDEKIIKSIRNTLDNLNELYDTIKTSNYLSEITKEEFFFFVILK